MIYEGSSPWERESSVIHKGSWHWERETRVLHEGSWPWERASVVIYEGSLPWERARRAIPGAQGAKPKQPRSEPIGCSRPRIF